MKKFEFDLIVKSPIILVLRVNIVSQNYIFSLNMFNSWYSNSLFESVFYPVISNTHMNLQFYKVGCISLLENKL